MSKPVRLEFNNSGAWKVLGQFNLDNPHQAGNVMHAAEQLLTVLYDGTLTKQWPSLRISTDDGLATALFYWTAERGGWFDAKTKEPV